MKKPKTKAPQAEIAGLPFNLIMEEGEDGTRVTAERRKAEDQRAADEAAQTTLF